MNLSNLTIVGNLTSDPKFFPSKEDKRAFCRFTVAVNTFVARDSTETNVNFYDVSAFSELAEGISTSLSKGQRVIVYGHLTTSKEPFTTEDGKQASRTRIGIVATAVGPDLFRQYARVAKMAASNASQPVQQEAAPAQGPVLVAVGASAPDEEPF